MGKRAGLVLSCCLFAAACGPARAEEREPARCDSAVAYRGPALHAAIPSQLLPAQATLEGSVDSRLAARLDSVASWIELHAAFAARPIVPSPPRLGATGDPEQLLALHDEVRPQPGRPGDPCRQAERVIAGRHAPAHHESRAVRLRFFEDERPGGSSGQRSDAPLTSRSNPEWKPMEPRSRFTDKSILVTGASSGIGRACALALGREGARVVAAGRRRERLDQVASAIREAGGECEAVTGDVRDPDTCAAWVKAAVGRFGGLDGLVNAAGVIGNTGLLDTTPEEWDRVMDSNLRSVFLMTKVAAPELIRRKGSVASISSVAGPRPYANLLSYCVSKAGVDQFTRCVSLELAPHGVRVNAVCPGVVVTELHTVTHAIPDYPGFLERSKTTHPLGRVGQPAEIASLVLFLLSDEAGWITGVTYSIDGGRALASAR